MTANDVLDYWQALGSKGWWVKKPEIDQEIDEKFGQLHKDACKGKLDEWSKTPDGTLALIIILDQFSRNLRRNSPNAFAQDEKALAIAKEAVEKGFDHQSREELRLFFYLPFEHSEEITDQHRSVELLHSFNDSPEFMKAAIEHRDIIEQFGRFPHRNVILGRDTTPAEQAYLDGGGFKG